MKNQKIKSFIAPLFLAVLLFVGCMFLRGGFFGDVDGRAATVIDGLANCFTIPGILLAGVGAISWASSFGTFDMMGYGTKVFLGVFIRSIGDELPKNFYEYRKAKNEKGRKWLRETFIVGVAFLVLGLIFTLISVLG